MRPLNQLTEDQYEGLKSLGLLFEIYPYAKGVWKTDCVGEAYKIRYKHIHCGYKLMDNKWVWFKDYV